MKKIIVIGCPRAGKSTFARKLRDLSGLPLFYLDRIWHKADRTTVTREEFDTALEQILSGDEWIIDGNYIRTIETRLRRCDAVFFLDYPTDVCLEGARSRVGTVREDMPWVDIEVWGQALNYIQQAVYGGKGFEVTGIFDEDGSHIDSTPHPAMRFVIYAPFEIRKGDILRRA